MQEKLAIKHCKRVSKQNTLPAKNAVNNLYDATTLLDLFLDIWRIVRYVCLWFLWFSKHTISSTVIMFSPVRVCFSLLVLCLWSVLHVSQISFNNISTLAVAVYLQKFCQYSPKTVFFESAQVPYPSFVSGTLHHRYIVSELKIIIYDNIICFCLQTSEMYVALNII